MFKKGVAVTIFIVLGLVAVIVIGIIVLVNTASDEGSIESQRQEALAIEASQKPVQAAVRSCFDELAKEGLQRIGLQGGYYAVPPNSMLTKYGDVPFYYYEGQIGGMPTSDEMANELGAYVSNHIEACMNNFQAFPGIEVKASEPRVFVTIGSQYSIILQLEWPIEARIGNAVENIDPLETIVSARLADIHSLSTNIVTQTIADPYHIYTEKILDYISDYDLQIDTITYDGDKVLYVIQDKQHTVKGIPFVFLFLVQIDRINNPPEILTEEIIAKVGEEVSEILEVYDWEQDDLLFFSNSTLFNIDPYTGIIKFTPRPSLVGVNTVPVIVSDGKDETSKDIVVRIQP